MAANSKGLNHKLSHRSDYLQIKKCGRIIRVTPWLIAGALENSEGLIRVGLTIPTYVGSAVVRNRMKRWVRNFIQNMPEERKKIELDLNLIFRRSSKDFFESLEHEVLDEALERLFKKIS